jgi:hypothetical protein
MPPTAPIAASASPAPPVTAALTAGPQDPGAAADQQRAGLEALMSQIREIGQQVQAIATDYPNLAADAQGIMQQLKKMVVSAAQQAPQQTASGAAVPMGGG